MTKRSKRAEAGVIQNGPGGSQEYPKHSKQNAVIRSAAALRAPLISIQNVKQSSRTLPTSHQQVSTMVNNFQKIIPVSQTNRVRNKTQTRHVLCRPPGAKMFNVDVNFTKSLSKVPPGLPKGSKKTSQNGTMRIY